MRFKEDVKITDRFRAVMKKLGGGGWGQKRIVNPRNGGGEGAPPIRVESNVHIKKIRESTGKVEETRDSHNIFLDYGRDWIAHLIALQTISPDSTFRDDRLRYMAVGIGGTSQLLDHTTIEATSHGDWDGYAQNWGGGAAGAPTQEDVDPTVLGLEWPVLVDTGEYYDDISAPVTFPVGTIGIARFTTVLGVNEVSFGTHTSVPLSEVGLFTQRVYSDLGGLSTPPVVWPGETYAEKAMVAYNTFDTLSKTNAFVLQFDWELRFS